jgi:hypothetical protein
MDFFLGEKIETKTIFDNIAKSRFLFPREKDAEDE